MMMKIKSLISFSSLLFFNFNYCQFKLINSDTINTDFYGNKKEIIKSFKYRRQFTTTQTGEPLVLFLDSICNTHKQKQKVIYGESYNKKYSFYRDSLIIRNWNLRDSPIKNKNYFEINIYLKSKEYDNLGISIMYNRNDTLSRRLLIFKPDPVSFYCAKYISDTNFEDSKLLSSSGYKITDNSGLYLYFNKKNSIEKLEYTLDDKRLLCIKFFGFYIPIEYGFRNYNDKMSRIGTWYTYFENGKLSSEGEYCGSKFEANGKEYDIKKTGKWVYYTNQGCIDKEETWDNGVLIYPTNKTKKKVTKKKK